MCFTYNSKIECFFTLHLYVNHLLNGETLTTVCKAKKNKKKQMKQQSSDTFETWSKTWVTTTIVILTHLPLVPHICVSESDEHWFR